MRLSLTGNLSVKKAFLRLILPEGQGNDLFSQGGASTLQHSALPLQGLSMTKKALKAGVLNLLVETPLRSNDPFPGVA